MAGSHITMNNSVYAQEIRNGVSLLQAAVDKVNAVKASADSRAADPDYSAIESALGLSNGQGQLVYNNLAALKAVLSDPIVTGFLKDFSF
jgi:hypothetical protein